MVLLFYKTDICDKITLMTTKEKYLKSIDDELAKHKAMFDDLERITQLRQSFSIKPSDFNIYWKVYNDVFYNPKLPKKTPSLDILISKWKECFKGLRDSSFGGRMKRDYENFKIFLTRTRRDIQNSKPDTAKDKKEEFWNYGIFLYHLDTKFILDTYGVSFNNRADKGLFDKLDELVEIYRKNREIYYISAKKDADKFIKYIKEKTTPSWISKFPIEAKMVQFNLFALQFIDVSEEAFMCVLKDTLEIVNSHKLPEGKTPGQWNY